MSVNEKMTAIADAIRTKTGGTKSLTLDQMAVEIAGIQTGVGEELFSYVTGLNRMFEGAIFPEGYELSLNVPNLSEGMGRVISYAKNLKRFTLKGNTKNVAMDCQYGFRGGNMLEVIDFSELGEGGLKLTYMNGAFSANQKLISILGEIDFSEAVNVSSSFEDCFELREIRFKEGTLKKSLSIVNSSKLSDDSIQSAIDGLADMTDGTAQTLTLHATVGGKLADAQKAAATAKNWTIVY